MIVDAEQHTYARKLPSELLANCRVLRDRVSLLPLLPKGKVICEVGVALGDFTQLLLEECQPQKFYAVDLFGLHTAPQMWGGRVGEVLGGSKHIDYFRDKFQDSIDKQIMRVFSGDSADALHKVPAGVDVFYLDADHSYSSVAKELSIIKHKVADDGIIIFNDYIMADWLSNTKYGVIQAVHEFMIENRWEMTFLCLHTGMYCDVAISKLP